jgi:decaprenyl-phosphate phosphoribosyltransferase
MTAVDPVSGPRVTAAVAGAVPRSLPREVLRASRPRQWVKNLLVLAAPAAAGLAQHPQVLARTLLAAVAFTLVASGCYLANDVIDAELDRLHPRKALRPIASGAVSEGVALVTAGVLLAGGLGLGLALGPAVLTVVGVYAGLTIAYALVLKGLPWLELAVVASGFVLRALAGAAAARVAVSAWFLLVVTAAAVHVVSSKRTSELRVSDARSRPVLRHYSDAALRRVRAGSALLLLLCYAGWAATRPGVASVVPAVASLAAVAAVLQRWNRQTDQGLTGAPEEALVRDRVIRGGVLAWAVCFALTVATAS